MLCDDHKLAASPSVLNQCCDVYSESKVRLDFDDDNDFTAIGCEVAHSLLLALYTNMKRAWTARLGLEVIILRHTALLLPFSGYMYCSG